MKRFKPKYGWTCFHCDETFTDERDARNHFGASEAQEAACKIKAGGERALLESLRRAEADAAEAWGIIHSESSEMQKAYETMSARHSEQLERVEVLGYERGLRDGLRMSAEERASLYADV